MRILVTGREGQLARALVELSGSGAGEDVEVVALGRPDLDITSADHVRAAMASIVPDIVVNAAAYTAVDKAEDDAGQAFLVNATGAGNVAAAAAERRISVVHVSTDYVFPGTAETPLRETDAVAPLGVYGRSKREGEIAVASVNPRHVIVRTAWVHSAQGANFVKTMLRLAGDRDVVNVVADQRGTPTYAPDLAEGIVTACRHALRDPEAQDWRGTFHLTNGGETNWADFAAEVFACSAVRGGPQARVERIKTDQYPTRARRPAYSVLETARFRNTFGFEPPSWQDGVRRCVEQLLGRS